MKSGRTIDISKSSLVSLKAELSRKQEEVQKAKLQDSYIRPVPKPKKEPKLNPGVEERNEKDKQQELTVEEVNLLQKSRDVLELKSKLYDKLQSGSLVQDAGKSEYLVNFKQKISNESAGEGTSKQTEDQSKGDTDKSDADELDSFSDSDSDWVEFTDCLGRTRKCLKEDLHLMKNRDERLAQTLGLNEDDRDAGPSGSSAQRTEEGDPELVSSDMHREMLRQKWEEQASKLADKKNVYYEDVRFDEARTHGVGYFQFSTDDAVREEQQEKLRKVRAETEKRQQEALALRLRRDRQKQTRLIAARQRQRARLNLPPIEIDETNLEESPEESKPPEEKAEEIENTKEGLELALKRAAHVRPWDVGKDGVRQPVMSQEEWVEKKRSERPEEFGPVYPAEEKRDSVDEEETTHSVYVARPLGGNKKRRVQPTFRAPEPYRLQERAPFAEETRRRGGGGVEIPPPPTFEYYGPSGSAGPKHQTPRMGTEESIEAGLKYLREQSDRSVQDKGLLDIV